MSKDLQRTWSGVQVPREDRLSILQAVDMLRWIRGEARDGEWNAAPVEVGYKALPAAVHYSLGQACAKENVAALIRAYEPSPWLLDKAFRQACWFLGTFKDADKRTPKAIDKVNEHFPGAKVIA